VVHNWAMGRRTWRRVRRDQAAGAVPRYHQRVKVLLFRLLLSARTAWTWLQARLTLVSRWLVIVGLGLIAYGVVSCLKGYPYPVVILMVYSGYGTLALGAGLSLRRPETTATLVMATICHAVSLVLLVVTQPGSVFSIALLPLVGALSGFIRLRLRRANNRPKPPAR
jgi:hypothetical protein